MIMGRGKLRQGLMSSVYAMSLEAYRSGIVERICGSMALGIVVVFVVVGIVDDFGDVRRFTRSV